MNNMQLLIATLYKSIVAIIFYLPRGKNNHHHQQNSSFIGMTAQLAKPKVKKPFMGISLECILSLSSVAG